MIEIRTQSNINRIRLQFANLTGGMEEKATIRALNRAGDQSVTAASREIRRVYNISAGRARQQIKVRNRAQHGKLYFTIRIFSRRIPLIEFGARQTKRGVTVAVRKGARKLIRTPLLRRWAAAIAECSCGHTAAKGILFFASARAAACRGASGVNLISRSRN